MFILHRHPGILLMTALLLLALLTGAGSALAAPIEPIVICAKASAFR